MFLHVHTPTYMKCGEKDLKEQQQFIMFLPGIPTQTLPRGQKQMLYICITLIFYNFLFHTIIIQHLYFSNVYKVYDTFCGI